MAAPRRWTRVDRIARLPKPYLTESDICFYYLQKDNLGFGQGPHASENQRIINFKHDPVKYPEGTAPFRYKQRAISEFVSALSFFLRENASAFSGGASLVPIPTSKPRESADYDSRLDDLCSSAARSVQFAKFCPALETRMDMGKVHRGEAPRNPDSIMRNIMVDSAMLSGSHDIIALVDDVLTTGAHYAACKKLVLDAVPDRTIIGLFLSIQLPDECDGTGWL